MCICTLSFLRKRSYQDRALTYTVGVDGIVQNKDMVRLGGEESFKWFYAVVCVNGFRAKYVENWQAFGSANYGREREREREREIKRERERWRERERDGEMEKGIWINTQSVYSYIKYYLLLTEWGTRGQSGRYNPREHVQLPPHPHSSCIWKEKITMSYINPTYIHSNKYIAMVTFHMMYHPEWKTASLQIPAAVQQWHWQHQGARNQETGELSAGRERSVEWR